ncbi:hypothetical protein V8G54_025769 [Vigna mungo]|uniref:Photosystem I reaction center subunit V, chloroplastic n=1 Tax=Vigna mungo TaxID=3915 RepID=A0AAQ3MXK8_VIGMU
MAASASSMISTSAALSATIQKHHLVKPSNVCFQGLRPLTRSTASARVSTSKRVPRGNGVVKAELNSALGRFVFFNFQRENVAKQVPEQNGLTHFEAGDTRAKEYVSLLKSNDPVGFNIVDVLAWGSIGHVVAYYILATTSNGYNPAFF